MSRIPISPVYVIAGFLGSGKTTLLKRALAYELDKGVTPAVIMNEFGEIDVDGAALHEHPRSKDVELQALLNGCICCDLSGEFSEKVGQLVKASKGAPVFIETTGLADTGQVVVGVEQALNAQSGEKVSGALAAVIVMVDAPRFMNLDRYWDASEQHLKYADAVVLNKIDQVDAKQVDLVERRIRATNPKARIIRAEHANVEVDHLLKSAEIPVRRFVMDGVVKDSAVGYQSGSFKVLRPFNPDRLKAMLLRYQRTVLRLKGFIRVEGQTGFHEVQWIMGSFAITPYRGSKPSQATIVVIGRRVAWDRFLNSLEHCLVRPKRQTNRWSGAKMGGA